jgi:endo-alpha-1,4-polygalactosaminidase (GH114 family)
MIDAEFRSEEKFSRLSLAYEGETEKVKVCSCVEKIIEKHKIKPETYTTCVSNGKEVFVIEYSDDNNREVGAIFEEMIKALEIKKCI